VLWYGIGNRVWIESGNILHYLLHLFLSLHQPQNKGRSKSIFPFNYLYLCLKMCWSQVWWTLILIFFNRIGSICFLNRERKRALFLSFSVWFIKQEEATSLELIRTAADVDQLGNQRALSSSFSPTQIWPQRGAPPPVLFLSSFFPSNTPSLKRRRIFSPLYFLFMPSPL